MLGSVASPSCLHHSFCGGIIWVSCSSPRKLLSLWNQKWSWTALRTENRREWVLMSIERTHYYDQCTLTRPMSLSVSFTDREKQLELPMPWLYLRGIRPQWSPCTAALLRHWCPSRLLWSVSVLKYCWNGWMELLGKSWLVRIFPCVILYSSDERTSAGTSLGRSLSQEQCMLCCVTVTAPARQ